MGKTKKKHNWKSRQVVKTVIDKTQEKKIVVESTEGGHYDEANPLVLPSRKRVTKVERPKLHNVRLLSKKKRKMLEKIVEKKKKKANREELIAELSQVSATSEQLNKMVSIATAQTKGLKRRYNEDEQPLSGTVAASEGGSQEGQVLVNSIKGAKKRLRLLAAVSKLDLEKKKKARDLNVVGFESSSDETSDEDDEPAEIKEEPLNEESLESTLSEETSESNEQTTVKSLQKSTNENETSKCTRLTVDETSKNEKPEVSTQNSSITNSPSGSVNASMEKTETKNKEERKPAVFVPVDRKAEIQEARLKLPILAEEQLVMETISENLVVVIAGETGSGKTTQVPQFLYEAGYTRNGKIIGVTEPRRVAAISMARRVGEELNLGSDQVSYLIRFEGNVTPETKIKFMTDGVLLKEMTSDFLLSKYSVVILDEAHERSVYTDILMGLLSRVVILRNKKNDPLKLIIMSATLRLEDFTENKNLFRVPPPIIKVEARQFPVTVHFNKRTNPDYVKEAYRKACKIHTQLPDGGILIFLTGQQEVNTLVSKLRKAFPFKLFDKKRKEGKGVDKEPDKETTAEVDEEVEIDLSNAMQRIKRKKKERKIVLPDVKLDDYDVAPTDDTEGDLLASVLEAESDEEDWNEELKPSNAPPLWVLPLYSILPSREQAKVFQGAPEGARLCVVATNVAETSLTIPGVKYVVDSGKVKSKLYDKVTGVSGFRVTWTSKAAANQRAGRAGRTSPGHCYRLYSSAVFNDEFEGWSLPEIKKRPVDELVLQMKSLGIDKVVNFPFPSPPDPGQLRDAERRLIYLGALQRVSQPKGKDGWVAKLTTLGEAMSKFPLAPRFAKMLCLSTQHEDLLQYTLALVAALSVQELLLSVPQGGGGDEGKVQTIRRSWAQQGNFKLLGDAMVLLRVIGGAEFANSVGKLEDFCQDHKIRHKGIIEARKIRLQLTNEINLTNPDLNLVVDPKMKPPTETQAKLLRQIVLSGMIDQVARKVDTPLEGDGKATGRRKRPLYHTALLEEPVTLHSSSVLYRAYPDWIVFQEIYETSFNEKTKVYLRGITAIEPEWLVTFAPALCQLGAPLDSPPPRYDPRSGTMKCHVSGTFGKRGWKLPDVEVEFPEGLDKYKWFAMYFLDGTVFPLMKKFTKSLLSTPKTMIRSWARLQPRTEYLLQTLVSKEVDSKEKLLEIWKTDSQYLLEAYQQWLPESMANEAAVDWPPTG